MEHFVCRFIINFYSWVQEGLILGLCFTHGLNVCYEPYVSFLLNSAFVGCTCLSVIGSRLCNHKPTRGIERNV